MNEKYVSGPESSERMDENKSWILLAAVIVIGISTAMLVPVFTTQELHPFSLLYSVILSTVSFSGIWKLRHKEILPGAGLGAVLGVIMFGIASVASMIVTG